MLVIPTDDDHLVDVVGEELAARLGPVYTSAALSDWLGVRERDLLARAARHELLDVTTGDGHLVYPAWQFAADGSVRPGVHEALEALAPVMDDWTCALWCASASPDLDGQSAVEWLSGGGDPGVAMTLARRTANRLGR